MIDLPPRSNAPEFELPDFVVNEDGDLELIPYSPLFLFLEFLDKVIEQQRKSEDV